MPKITVMSAEKAFLSAHYGGPFKKEDYIIVSITNPRSQGCPRFQSGEELANSVGKINAYYSL